MPLRSVRGDPLPFDDSSVMWDQRCGRERLTVIVTGCNALSTAPRCTSVHHRPSHRGVRRMALKPQGSMTTCAARPTLLLPPEVFGLDKAAGFEAHRASTALGCTALGCRARSSLLSNAGAVSSGEMGNEAFDKSSRETHHGRDLRNGRRIDKISLWSVFQQSSCRAER